MTRKFKASRPDPVQILSNMRSLMAELNTYKLEIEQADAEIVAHNDAVKKAMAKFEGPQKELQQRLREAQDNFQHCQRRYISESIEALGALIEDMAE